MIEIVKRDDKTVCPLCTGVGGVVLIRLVADEGFFNVHFALCSECRTELINVLRGVK